MGYGQTTQQAPQQAPPSGPPVQDTLSQLLGVSFDRLLEIEGHLGTIRDRIQARPSALEKNAQPIPTMGVLHQASDIRSAVTRILDRCSEIESLL